MRMLKNWVVIMFAVVCSNNLYSQDQRIIDNNSIGWIAVTNTLKLNKKIAFQGEYQWRRLDGLQNPQQGLLRMGISYSLRKEVNLIAGYAFADTHPYGDYPNANRFAENRIYEQVVIKNPIGKVDVSHRFTLEQRFLEKFTTLNGVTNTEWVFMNRMRYRLRTEIPVYKSSSENNSVSIILLDEVFVGFGKNVGANVFDQNRMAALLGYKVNKNIKLEAGYLGQILQQGKLVNGKPVFQYNNGFMFTTHLSFDAMK
ncbi:DUF2490 domain-containing protein [Flavobacterium sp. K5-23]|uniref:DUF2490 domain-containing protein n=1 Tax=Flavobacterium sp. K5-23 TaxID=2746225 RepID=UPI0020106396|nr:DUF2490 domain-containing protein [Flavobacterium sp. K5-23]UQD55320.1 DUF2490 domain-containing protein [Flavobacterium sp. K5-23]